jgi:hypothetical protein
MNIQIPRHSFRLVLVLFPNYMITNFSFVQCAIQGDNQAKILMAPCNIYLVNYYHLLYLALVITLDLSNRS